jgi:signal transduction histidine kinase
MQVGSRDTEKAQEPLQRVLAAGKHLLGLINQVLDLSKIETGQLELNPQTVQLAPLIEEVAGTAKQLAEANKNRLIVDTPGDLGAQTADPIRLRQIMLNLLSNACKFTKGEVKLQARRVRNGRDWIYRPSSNYCTDIRSKGGKGHAHIDPRFMSRQRRSHVRARFCNRQSTARRLYADLGRAAAKGAQRPYRSARCVRRKPRWSGAVAGR